jgi:hypothetical protein
MSNHTFYEKINQKIADFISANNREPNQIIMNNEDFIEFKKMAENLMNCEIIDVDAKLKYMGKEIIRTKNIKKGEIQVGLFN